MKRIILSGLIFLTLITAVLAAQTSIPVAKISTHVDNMTEDDQAPQVAIDSSGNSYVVWEGYDGDDQEIYWVKITSAGTPGTVEKISTHADNQNQDDYSPQIAVDSLGNSYVVWYGYDGADDEIYWVRITSTGILGAVVKISTHADNVGGYDRDPQISTDPSGTSYVTWWGSYRGTQEIYWVKMTPAGTPGSVQKISTHQDNVTWNDYNPQISTDPSGISYITWYGYDGNDQEIYWVKITSAGTPGTVVKISTHTDNQYDDWYPQISTDPSGTSYITWYGYDGNDQEIYWVKIPGAGTPGTVIKISTHDNNENWDDYNPQITVNSSGNSYVVWYGYDGTDDEIYWVTITSAGIPKTVMKISTHQDNVTRYDRDPQITVDLSGSSYMVWHGSDGTDSEIYYALTPSAPTTTDFTGPKTSNIEILGRPPYALTVILTATVDDSSTGGSTIKAAEYFIDTKGANGTGKSMSASDGTFNSPKEAVRAVVYVTGLSEGTHTVYVHGRDEYGNWGPFQLIYLSVYYRGAE